MILRKINNYELHEEQNTSNLGQNTEKKINLGNFAKNGNKTMTVPTSNIADFPEIHMIIAKKMKDCVALNSRCIKKKIFTSRDYQATTIESG